MKLKNCRNYFALNKYVENLPQIKPKNINKKFFREDPDSVVKQFFYKILLLFKCILHYFLELFIGGKYLISLFFFKKNNNKDYAIIFGNGPSLDIIKNDELKKIGLFFDIYVVNNFIKNKIFNKNIPNFYVSSDPVVFTKHNQWWSKKEQNTLLSYLKKNKNINIFTPVLNCKNFVSIFGASRIFGFIDSEARGLSDNTLPIFPRGYVSSTVLKAICIANWIGYKKIFVLGVDNTYPRDLFINKKNDILNLENHSKSQDYVLNQSAFYQCTSQVIFDFYKIFKDYKKINKKKNIYNLDQYSLTGYDKTYDIKKLLKKLLNRQIL